MYHKLIVLLTGVALTIFSPLTSAAAQAEYEIEHRKEYQMNFISGGNFRAYISQHITEEDLWGHSMRRFGAFHDLMHELMTELAWHHAYEFDGKGVVPDEELRISGGQWTEYRENIEKKTNEIDPVWTRLVLETEIMHDRVHHAMYKSTVYDQINNYRDAELTTQTYLRYEPFSTDEVLPESTQLDINQTSLNSFRKIVWADDFEQNHLRSTFQKALIWREMLTTLLTDWGNYAVESKPEACHPPEMGPIMTDEQWSKYSKTVVNCEDEKWRNHVQATDLMIQRINQLLYNLKEHYVDNY